MVTDEEGEASETGWYDGSQRDDMSLNTGFTTYYHVTLAITQLFGAAVFQTVK